MRKKSLTFKILVRGDRACFTRPEMKIERYSYEVMTPSAARGVLTAILWHPAMEWVVEKIHVLKPVNYDYIMRNELKIIPKKDSMVYIGDNRTQRGTTFLTDVAYVVEAHFELQPTLLGSTDTYVKFEEMMLRRLTKGQQYRQPFLGCREFPADVSIAPESWDVPLGFRYKDLGIMFKGWDYSKEPIQPKVFHAVMNNGCITVPEEGEHV